MRAFWATSRLTAKARNHGGRFWNALKAPSSPWTLDSPGTVARRIGTGKRITSLPEEPGLAARGCAGLFLNAGSLGGAGVQPLDGDTRERLAGPGPTFSLREREVETGSALHRRRHLRAHERENRQATSKLTALGHHAGGQTNPSRRPSNNLDGRRRKTMAPSTFPHPQGATTSSVTTRPANCP